MTEIERAVYDILEFMKDGQYKDSRSILLAMKEKGWAEEEALNALTLCVETELVDLGGMGVPGQALN